MIDCREDLKQELVFITVAEQCRARCIATLSEIKEFNAAIKKEMTACKATLDILKHMDDKNEVPTGGLAEHNNSHNSSYASYTTTITIDNNSNVEQ